MPSLYITTQHTIGPMNSEWAYHMGVTRSEWNLAIGTHAYVHIRRARTVAVNVSRSIRANSLGVACSSKSGMSSSSKNPTLLSPGKWNTHQKERQISSWTLHMQSSLSDNWCDVMWILEKNDHSVETQHHIMVLHSNPKCTPRRRGRRRNCSHYPSGTERRAWWEEEQALAVSASWQTSLAQ